MGRADATDLQLSRGGKRTYRWRRLGFSDELRRCDEKNLSRVVARISLRNTRRLTTDCTDFTDEEPGICFPIRVNPRNPWFNSLVASETGLGSFVSLVDNPA